jgi:ABC-type Fe3+ transport system substrate-binding protein
MSILILVIINMMIFYKQAKVKITGKQPGTWITKKGKSCTYGVTMIKDAPNPEAAKLFLAFLLSPDHGLKTLKTMPRIYMRDHKLEIKKDIVFGFPSNIIHSF